MKSRLKCGVLGLMLCLGLTVMGCGGGGSSSPSGTSTASGDSSVVLTFSISDLNYASYVVSYDISGSGPSSATYNVTGVTDNSKSITSLAAGSWTFVVEAKNSFGVVIGKGTKTLTLGTEMVSGAVTVNLYTGRLKFTQTIDIRGTSLSGYLHYCKITGTNTYGATFATDAYKISRSTTTTFESLPIGEWTFTLKLYGSTFLEPGFGTATTCTITKDATATASVTVTDNSTVYR